MKTTYSIIPIKVVTILLLSLISIFVLTSCKKLNVPGDTPSCIKSKIRKIKSEEVRNPPAKVIEWSYNGEKYYYIPPYCCDIPSELYDKKCNLICHPDGGISGGGDGKCPDFSKGTLTKKVIWEDDRK